VEVSKVRKFALPAAVLAKLVVNSAKRPGFDPTEKLDVVYFRGTPMELRVEGLPEERLGELLAVELASGIGEASEAGSPGARRVELGALFLVVAGPLVKERALAGVEALRGLAGGLREKLRSRRHS
jgi:hypothetical protein